MARVLIATQAWGVVYERTTDRTLKVPAAATAAAIDTTVYASSSGSGTVDPFVTNSLGQLPGYVEEGVYSLTVGADTYEVQAASGTAGARADAAAATATAAGTGLASEVTARTDAITAAIAAAQTALDAESAARTTADALLAPKASPALTGNPTVPTQAPGDDSTRASSTAFTTAAVAAEAGVRQTADNALTDAQAAHAGATSGAHAASAVSYTPGGTVSATNLQGAVAEVASEADTRLLAVESGSAAATSAISVLGGRPIHVELPPYSVAPDGGVLDQTTAFQAALDAAAANGGEVYAPGVYKASLTLPKRVTLVGSSHRQNNAVPGGPLGSRLVAPSAAVPIITLPDSGALAEVASGGIRGMVLQGGQDSIRIPRGALSFYVDDVLCTGYVRSGIYATGFVQEMSLRRVEFLGGQYGFYMPDDAAPAGSYWRLDKCDFDDVYCHGQTINNVYVKAIAGATSNVVTWRMLRLVNAVNDGMYLAAGLQYWHFDSVNAEGTGYTGTAAAAPTTGAITAGSPTLTVASTTGLAVNGPVCVQGAGSNGLDLRTTILDITGLVVTLNTNAGRTVAGAEVTSRQWSDIKLVFANGSSPQSSTFTNFVGGQENGTNATLYGLDLAGGYDNTVVGATTIRPNYDPTGRNLWLGGRGGSRVRSAASYPGTLIEGSTAGARAWRGSGIPVVSTHVVGDRVTLSAPVDGGPVGYVCTAGGTPGTWLPFGVINSATDKLHAATLAADVTNASVTPADAGLPIAISGSTTQLIEFTYELLVNAANATEDIVFSFTRPTGCTLLWGGSVGGAGGSVIGFGASATTTTPATLQTAGQTLPLGTGAGTTGITIKGKMIASGTSVPGTLQLQFAQNTADAGTLKLLKGSSVVWRELQA